MINPWFTVKFTHLPGQSGNKITGDILSRMLSMNMGLSRPHFTGNMFLGCGWRLLITDLDKGNHLNQQWPRSTTHICCIKEMWVNRLREAHMCQKTRPLLAKIMAANCITIESRVLLTIKWCLIWKPPWSGDVTSIYLFHTLYISLILWQVARH